MYKTNLQAKILRMSMKLISLKNTNQIVYSLQKTTANLSISKTFRYIY